MFHRTIIFSSMLLASCALLAILPGCQQRSKYDLQLNCNRQTDLQCATNALKDVEQQLSETYQLAADAQEDESAKRLRLSQRNWLKFRDSYAEFISLREIDANKSQLALVNQKIDSNLTRMMELRTLVKAR